MKKLVPLLLTLAVLSACSPPSPSNESSAEAKSHTHPAYIQTILDFYQFENWDKVEQLTFDFVVERGDAKRTRTWRWDIPTGMVMLTENGDTTLFNTNKVDTANEQELIADQKFINDKYWVLFPYQLAWDSTATLKHLGEIPSRMDTTRTHAAFEIQYPADGGYTPGDKYVVLYEPSGKLTEWHYYPAGADSPAMVTSWEKENGKVLKITPFHRVLNSETLIYTSIFSTQTKK